MMRAARLVAPERFVIERVSKPEPKPHEVRFRVEGCGVCASNLGPWFGLPWTQYPLAPGESGHEAWGIVDAVGREVSGIFPGDRIAALSNHAYAEFDVASAGALLPIPRALSHQSLPAEPFGCAFNIFERAAISPGDCIAIIGIGFLGAILTHLAMRRGARVIAISRRPFSLELARKLGASETLLLDDHQRVLMKVAELTDNEGCRVVIEATGKQWPLDVAAELAATRGRLVIAGYHQDGARQVNMQLWNWKGLDVINAHERDGRVYLAGMREAFAAVLDGSLDPAPLLSHRYSLDQLDEALTATHERPTGFVKAVVLP